MHLRRFKGVTTISRALLAHEGERFESSKRSIHLRSSLMKQSAFGCLSYSDGIQRLRNVKSATNFGNTPSLCSLTFSASCRDLIHRADYFVVNFGNTEVLLFYCDFLRSCFQRTCICVALYSQDKKDTSHHSDRHMRTCRSSICEIGTDLISGMSCRFWHGVGSPIVSATHRVLPIHTSYAVLGRPRLSLNGGL